MEPGAPERLNLYYPIICRIPNVREDLDYFGIKFKELCSEEIVWTGARGRKFECLSLKVDDNDDENEDDRLETIIDNTLAMRYWYDAMTSKAKWVRIISDDGKKIQRSPKQAKVILFNSADLVWFHPNLLLIRGSEENARIAFNRFRKVMKNKLNPKEISFDTFFLFWIWRTWSIAKKTKTKDDPVKLSKHLRVIKIRDAVALGLKGHTGERVSIDEMETKESMTLLHTLLSGRGIEELRCTFELETGERILARIFSNGTVRVRVGYSIKTSDSEGRRFALTIAFIDSLAKTFDIWRKLPKNEREPTNEVYEDIKATFKTKWEKFSKEDKEIRRAQKIRQKGRLRGRVR